MAQRASLWVLLAVAFALAGCSSSSSLALAPHRLGACPYQQEDPRRSSTVAMVEALLENRWQMVQGSLADGYLQAEACRRRACVTVDLYVDAGGNVELFTAPGQQLDGEREELLAGWLLKLDRRFEAVRCQPSRRAEGEAARLVLTRGVVPSRPSSPPGS